jgi:flagellar hook-length control protein FliK
MIMNNLPINLSAPPVNAKPTVTASGVNPKPAVTPNPANENAPQSQAFGEVLARQVADAEASNSDSPVTEAAEKNAAKKAVKVKTAEEIFEQLSDNRVSSDALTELPNNMLATLMPATVQATALPTASLSQDFEAAEQTEGAGQSASNALGLAQKKTTLSAQGDAREFANMPAVSAQSIAEQPGIKKETAFAGMMAANKEINANLLNNKDNIIQPTQTNPAPVLASTAPLTPANLMPAQLRIETPVTQRNWGDEFGQKITWIASSKEQSAELHLNPPQLGPMDVVLKVSGDQATALFTSPHAAVREAIEQAMPRLREMLADSGIMLGNATVSDQSSRQAQEGRGEGRTTRRDKNAENDSSAMNLSARVSPIRQHNGIVDTFA